MADIKKSVNLLPEYLRTDKNAKFLASTIDQLIQTPQVERVDGYVGSKLSPNYDPTIDFYLSELSELRKNYSLEPALVFKDSTNNITDVVAYDDLINELGIQGAKNKNLDNLLRSKFYSFDPLIEWDKLVNYTNYYWLPLGPSLIHIDDANLDVSNIVGQTSYTMSNGHALSNGMILAFGDNTIQIAYRQKEFVVEGVGTSIKLIDFNLLSSFDQLAQTFNETFDGTKFDEYPFDGDKKLPVGQDYITINRASTDLNPWTRYNRWFHKDVIATSATINKEPVVFPLDARAKRPIVEFRPNIKLYNYGTTGVRNVDLIDTSTLDAFSDVDGSIGYYIDGVLVQQGQRVIFNAEIHEHVRGKIYEVNYELTGSVPIVRLIPTEDTSPSNLDSVGVSLGTEYYGTNWYFDSSVNKWIFAQQHTKLNQPPLFDLFTNDGISYTALPETIYFAGTEVFGYAVGTGANDSVLGFPLKYQNTAIGTGSYLFENYFITDTITVVSNNISSTLSTAVTFLNVDGELVNIWAAETDYPIPVIEIQTVASSTNTLTLTCLDKPIGANTTASVYINNTKLNATINVTSAGVTLTTENTLSENDTVVIKTITDQVPNSNGYYEPPVGLTNNPLNGSIATLTLAELEDHLKTMVSNIPEYDGKNLRDLTDYTKYGSRLIVNANPISFAQIFFGKKDHNIIDSIRQAGDHYNQFKLNLLRYTVDINQDISPADALDIILTELNKSKDLKSLYNRSDMVGYGQNRTVRTFTVSDIVNTEYPVGFEFDLDRLSFKSVIIYLNGTQLIRDTDYSFNYIDGSVNISTSLASGDVINIHCYSDTLGCYVPPTPSKLGLYPAFEPAIFTDSTYINGTLVIRGHDGSIMKAYGDYRDAIVLEYETRVYNNIKVNYNNKLFDIVSIQPGAFRDSNYSIKELNDILSGDFSRWSGINNVDTADNSTFDEGNGFTWNYKGSVDNLTNTAVSGYWRNLYKYFFDTDRPHTHPWEMLGYSAKPTWWISQYGSSPYTADRHDMWADLEDGYDHGTDSINLMYARPGLTSIVPVDSVGNLKSPNQCLVSPNGYQDKQSNWVFGDQGPAETAWRRSSYWPFAISVAAALMDPCGYCSTMYDVSRTNINTLGQVTYKDDDLYLSPKKLIIDGEDQIAGFGVYIAEKGKQKDQNYLEKFRVDLDYLNVNLFHKLGGFASKEKLQIVIDSIDPASTSPGVVLPSEDYSLILNVSNPIKTARISGIIIQRNNGNFVIKGYDAGNPYFEIFRPIKTAMSGVVKVGGVSEQFSDWSYVANNGNKGLSSVDLTSASSTTTRYYKQGQLLRYSGKFYRVKTGHNAETSFDPSLYQQLPELPIVGGATVQLPSKYESIVTQIPYGSEFSTVQEVYDVILGYGAFLESQGFVFDEYNSDLNEIVNWRFTGKEFLYWTTQNWADGNLITLSPFSDYLKYSFPNSVADNIISTKYEYSLLKADGKPYPIDKFAMSRDDTVCTIKTTDSNEGLFFAILNSVQKEHAMVFNNYTMFNDTIYDVETGYRQRRIKLSGFRTKNWNGDLFSPGFVFDDVKITDWKAYGNYLPGSVVRYNGRYHEAAEKISADTTFDFTKWIQLSNKPIPQLLPNFDYKINQFEDFYSLDIDNFDSNQQELAQHLIGYTPRTYLNNIFTNPISQYKFYQGFIKDKGTKNAIDKLSKATQGTSAGSVQFKEEWAFRVGHYGSYENFNEIEFPLTEGTSLENPYVVKFVSSTPVDANPLINYLTTSSLLLTPTDYSVSNTFASYASTWNDTNLKLTTAGYVRPDDITSTAYNKNSLLDIANNSAIKEGDTIWLGFLENGDWTVYRYTNQLAKITGVFVSAPGSEITFVTDTHHNLQIGDIISVVRFNDQVNGVYVVTDIPAIGRFAVSSELTSIENDELINYGALYKFDNARYPSLNDLANVTDLLKLDAGDKVWVDSGVDSKWQVYEKVKNYSSTTVDTADTPAGQKFGYSIFASDDSSVMLVSSPAWRKSASLNWGRVKVYNNVNDTWTSQFDYILNSKDKTYCAATSSTQFGYSLQYDINKQLYITGAPEATYVRSTSTSTISSVGSNTATLYSTGTGYIRPFIHDGLVKISTEDAVSAEVVLANPGGANYSRFGHSVYINQTSTNIATKLLVGAPGPSLWSNSGTVYLYTLTTVLNTLTEITSPIVTPVSTVTSYVALTSNSEWGYKIAGCSIGFAISAPGFSNSTGVVQLFDRNLAFAQQIDSPFGVNGRFGHDIAVAGTGEYLLISAPEVKTIDQPYGKVVVYKFNTSTGQYVQHQTISNPLPTNDLKFGYSISISKDQQTIAAGALGKNRTKEQLFDTAIDVGQTTFDGDDTKFTESILDAGTVYLFNKVGEKFIQADELNEVAILEGGRYGNAVVVTNDEVFVGAPTSQSNSVLSTEVDESRFYIFNKIDSSTASWKLLREQVDTVDVTPLSRIALIDSLTEEITEYLNVFDPVKGKIVGLAEQELKYKAAFDPATYSIGLASTIVDTNTNWLDEHIGELWWDLSTTKYMWYEQGDDLFRKNNWGRLFPGSSIDVYEWVKSDLLPSEWAALADTTKGLVDGISGQPKYPDNSIISVKQVFNNVTGSFENVYYFWVKNKVTLPGTKNRRLSGFQVASYIVDPVANGLKLVEVLSPDSIAFANVQPMLVGDRINANISSDANSIIPKHTEWLLLNEGDHTSVPNTLLEKKLFDSLLGHDTLGNEVPSRNLTSRNRYGIGIRPQQTLFKDKSAALRNLIYFSNSVFAENRIVGNYSFENLNKKEEIPALYSYEYDQVVEDIAALGEILTLNYVRAEVECYAENGKLRNVVITNPGFGYTVAPKITITSITGTGGEVVTEIDSQGRLSNVTVINAGSGYASGDSTGTVPATVRPHTAIVQVNETVGNRWSKHTFDYINKVWVTAQTQLYNTPLYWETIDWVGSSFQSYKIIENTVSDLPELNSLTDVTDGTYVKVKNIGDGKYAILEKISGIGNYIPSYNIVYREQGTIRLLDTLWNYDLGKYAFDNASLEETLYDQVPDNELYYILTGLKNNIFINSLKVYWNLFFFAAVKYALTEQKLLDWAFKTSFINVLNTIGSLDQRPVYKLNNESYFEQYINEVKPYHTKIRNYTSIYDKLEDANLYTTDFDLPSVYNTVTGDLNVIDLSSSLINTYPWKSWKDNYKFTVGSIEVGYAGAGYTQRPTVTFTTATNDTGFGAKAEAYIRNGQLYKVIVTDPGEGYVITPLVTIVGGGSVTDTARVSVVMSNDNIRKNIIGIKFDRTSVVGDIESATVTEEFVCDGETNKFTLTWLASPDKASIVPTLDGKLIFGTDYTIEYYQVKVFDSGFDTELAFPENAWTGETSVDHRYRYFTNIETNTEPGYIRHYSRFIFLNTVPKSSQVFKITYNKNIDLYNAVDRIEAMYNPTDTMPGKELPLLMSGAEYPGTQIQGLPFDQTPTWDSTGTRYDSAPWGDYVGTYATAKLLTTAYRGSNGLVVDSTDGIVSGQYVSVLNTSSDALSVFEKNTVVGYVNRAQNNLSLIVLDSSDTKIKSIGASGLARDSIITIKTHESFHDSINIGDLIQISGVQSLAGVGIIGAPIPITTITTTSSVTIEIAPPDVAAPTSQQAYGIVQKSYLNTVTDVVITVPGMGYTSRPVVTFKVAGTTVATRLAYLDPGYNQTLEITTCTTNMVQVRSQFTLSSTATLLELGAKFDVISVLSYTSATNKLIDSVIYSSINETVPVINTFANFDDVVRGGIYLTTSTNAIPIRIDTTSTDTVWYDITNSIDGLNRAVVTLRHYNSGTVISGIIEANLYGNTELEFYSHNTDYYGLDSLVSGGSIQTSLGYNPEDIIVNGNNFLNSYDSYAPEECVPGQVQDALSIDVYTSENESYPVVISGAFVTDAFTESTFPLGFISDAPLGFMVNGNGTTLDRVDTSISFSTSTQYKVYNNQLIVAPQPVPTRIGYTYVTAGADVILDSAYVSTEVVADSNSGTISINSLMSIEDVQSAYVILNGNVVTEDASIYGYYRLEPVSSTNDRASVKIYGLGGNTYYAEVWFFDTPYPKFNRVLEQSFNVTDATSELTISPTPGLIEPVSEQVIVEKITSIGRTRMLPPWASYYKVRDGQTVFAIDPKNSRPGVYSLDNVKAYLNGTELRPGYDFSVNGLNETIILLFPVVATGDAIAITPLVDYDYRVEGDKIYFTSPVTTSTVKVTSFTDHDNMLIRTERFTANYQNEFVLSHPAISEAYVWVTIDDHPLVASYDYRLLDDFKTIELSEFVNTGQYDDVVITVVNPPSFGDTVLGFKIFKDMFGRERHGRIADYFNTRLADPLVYSSTSILVDDGSYLLQPNPGRNMPGVVFIDGERIEYMAKNGNVLSELRRATMGTGPALFSDVGTTVIDQSPRQNISTEFNTKIQHVASSYTTTYIISTLTNNTTTFSINNLGSVGAGITLTTATYHSHAAVPNAVDQVEVYYGGRLLRKNPIVVHDKSKSYYNSADSLQTLAAEFTITTSTQLLTLNIGEDIVPGIKITIVKREAQFWEDTSSTSLLTSAGTQAGFIRSRLAELPDVYYYGGEKMLLENSNALTDENGDPLEGY